MIFGLELTFFRQIILAIQILVLSKQNH
jgi:hypothetical protein